MFKEKFNFVADFTSMFSCFRVPGSLFLPRVLNRIILFLSNRRIIAALVTSIHIVLICLFLKIFHIRLPLIYAII